METNNFNYIQSEEVSSTMSKTFMASVFSWMSAALVITSIVAYYFGVDANLMSILRTTDSMGYYHNTIMGYVVMFSPLAIIFGMGYGMRKMSYPIVLGLFLLFAALMGASLSYIFLAYTHTSILSVFLSAAGMFGLMAVVGYTTKTDLTKFGSIMTMAFFGILIASLINIFLRSDGLDYIISFIGVLVFVGLTAYDVQKLKRIGAGVEYGTEETKKLVLWGALDLYLDFINLFLFLLRLFGDRK
ncbi:MAG: Inner rane protein YbhL [Bacteroidota bacterium]|jgi:FtsH-binding integral membrane protein|nr:Inner rane protein YbhL [Bacteroidota bacterium]